MKKILRQGLMIAMLTATIVSCSSSKKTTASNGQPNGGPLSTDELFIQMDSNKDGKLSKAEVKGPLANDFAKIDTNNDEFITKAELNKAPKLNGQGQPPRQ